MPPATMSEQPTKRKYHDSKNRTYLSISFSAPIELEQQINEAAAQKGMNRSQYIVWLIERDIYMSSGVKREFGFAPHQPTRKVPPRIRRKKDNPEA
jgi:hypothetical protein